MVPAGKQTVMVPSDEVTQHVLEISPVPLIVHVSSVPKRLVVIFGGVGPGPPPPPPPPVITGSVMITDRSSLVIVSSCHNSVWPVDRLLT